MRRIEDPTPVQFLRPKPSFQDLSPLQCGCLTLLNAGWQGFEPWSRDLELTITPSTCGGEGNRTPKSCYRFTAFQEQPLVHSDHLLIFLLWDRTELNGCLWIFSPTYNNHLYDNPICDPAGIRIQNPRLKRAVR